MNKVGLVLEGGGMRGSYTSGILDYFMEKELYLPYVIGASAGAGNALSYVSKQLGRTKKATVDSVEDPSYINYRNLIKHGYLINMDLLFDEFPNRKIPFDYDTYFKSEQECVIVTTNCKTGKANYFKKKDTKSRQDLMSYCRASSSLPFASPFVNINGEPHLDGGIADSIPIKKSISDGNDKNIIILTRDKSYRKSQSRIIYLLKRMYSKYPKLQEALLLRYKVYNETLDFIDKLEDENKVFVIRPSKPVAISRTEKSKEKLTELYNEGINDAKRLYDSICEWIG